MGVNGHCQTARRGAKRAIALMRLRTGARNAVNLLSALVILINAAVPYWHAAQRMAVWAAASAEPQAKHHAAMAGGAECPMHQAGTSEQKGGDETPPTKKPCPLCQALQLFSPGVTQPSLAFLPCAPAAVAAFVPHRLELKSGRETAEQGRPRAPPLA